MKDAPLVRRLEVWTGTVNAMRQSRPSPIPSRRARQPSNVANLNQHFCPRIEQTGLGHINSERYRLADRGRRIRLESGDDLAAANAHDHHGLGAGRLDDLDPGFEP